MSISVHKLLDGMEYQLQRGPDHSAPALAGLDLAGMTDDSRKVKPGDGFVAVAGAVSDGHAFVEQAIAAGAVLILAEKPLNAISTVPVIVVPQLARWRSELAGRLYRHPSQLLRVVGVTGTNGKTSVAHYIAELSQRLGIDSGYMGTVGWGRPGHLASANLTTVDALTLQQRLRDFADQGCQLAALEVSSHALSQHRLAAVSVDTAVFTNLSRDHLDFHGTLERYAQAKLQLFERAELQRVVTNVEDALGQRISRMVAARDNVALVCYGAKQVNQEAPADYVQWTDLAFGNTGIQGRWCTSWGEAPFALPLLGEFAVANVAAALAVLLLVGVEFEQAVLAANQLRGVPGRMERFALPGRPTVVVDYAHTPDALAKALAALRRHSNQRLVVVFGCGGDRDRGKRPQMGAVGAQLADVVYLTSDNPRGEAPMQILEEIAAGVPASAAVHRIVDREQAIAAAVHAAGVDDLVLVAGKGHEDYQEVDGMRRPFSDRDLVRSLLEEAA